MPLQTSGAISLNQIHVEAGGSSGTQASLNDSDIRGLIGKASGATMSFSEWYGASAYTAPTVDTSFLTTPTANGFARYRVTDGVNTLTGQTTTQDAITTLSLDTAAGRSLVLTIHVRDNDNSGNLDFIYGKSSGGATTIDSSNRLTVGMSASALQNSTLGTSATHLLSLTSNPDAGDRVQLSIRFAVTSAMIGNLVQLYYRDDPDDDDRNPGIRVNLT